MTRYYAWMNDLESYSSFDRKLLMKWYIEEEIDFLDRAKEVHSQEFLRRAEVSTN